MTPAGASVAKRRTRKDVGFDDTNVKQFVKASLFPRMKWVSDEAGDLSFSLEKNSVCYACLQFVGMLEESRKDKEQFWKFARNIVRTEVDQRRNQVQGCFKKEYIGALIC